MKKTILSFVLLVLAGALRAESVSLGTHGALEVAVPEGWHLKSKAMGELGCNISLDPSDNANARCMITVMYPAAPSAIDKAKIAHDFTAACDRFVAGSVEGKINVKELKLPSGYGLYATFTDAALVGKPSKPADYKVMTSGLAQFSEDVMAVVTVFTDDEHGPEQKALLATVSGLHLERTK